MGSAANEEPGVLAAFAFVDECVNDRTNERFPPQLQLGAGSTTLNDQNRQNLCGTSTCTFTFPPTPDILTIGHLKRQKLRK